MNNPHGGDLTTYEMQYKRKPLDFSASLNPLGMPEAVQQAALDAVLDSYAYPDPYARKLTEALATKLEVEQSHLLLGNGSADLIYRYAQAARPQKALLPAPSFAEYEQALTAVSTEIEYYTLRCEDSFDVDDSILQYITNDLDVVFLCQPNNPTGRLVATGVLDKLLEKCSETNTLLFLDECFVPFVADAGEVSRIGNITQFDKLFILGSFTKLYGMAGIRLGYALCSNATLLEKMRCCGQPWAVSTVAQAAGLAALDQDSYVQKSLTLLARENEWLTVALTELGMSVIGNAANYLFFVSQDTQLSRKLAECGIMIRDCSNYHGLGQGYYRIAVRQRDDNEQLINTLHEIVQQGEGGNA